MSSQNKKLNNQRSRTDLLTQEEQYKRLNAELEAKTANLVSEADAVLREQANILAKPSSLLDRVNDVDVSDEWEPQDTISTGIRQTSKRAQLPPAAPHQTNKATTSGAKPQRRTTKSAGVGPTPRSSRPISAASNAADDVALHSKEFSSDYSLNKTIASIEKRVVTGAYKDDDDDDVLPGAASEMAAEAQIRFLKAKLRVMQEEMDRVSQELSSKDDRLHESATTLKEVEEERGRLQRTLAAQQTQTDKYKKLSEDAKVKADGLEVQLTAVRKELDTMKRNQKQQATNQSATEVRLNRALEEVEKYRVQLEKAKATTKDCVDSDKRRADQLAVENKRLEKQKNELLAAFKKQLKLIDILKRQKMHIEAARMLAFTEEEFVKALEWGN